MIVPAGVFFLKKEHFASKQSARHLSISIIRLHLTLCTGVVRTKLSAPPGQLMISLYHPLIGSECLVLIWVCECVVSCSA